MEKFQSGLVRVQYGISFTHREQERMFGTPIIPNTEGLAQESVAILVSNLAMANRFNSAKNRERGSMLYFNEAQRDNAFSILNNLLGNTTT